MLIKCYGVLDKFPEIELEVKSGNLKEIFSLMQLHYGKEYIETVINNPFFYVLGKNNDPDASLALQPEILFSDFEGYDTLYIFPEVTGEIPVVAVAAVLGVSATSATAIIVTAVINIALSVALNMLMSMLSPTPEFSKDPAYSQNVSNLFNGAPILREQGGSVPLIFGNPYCGGFLISSGLFTEEL
jgi:hypothetical protein